MVYYAVHKWFPTNHDIDIVLTLTAPYFMYIAAETFHFSGVLSVVSGGLFLSARSHLSLTSRSRIRGSNVWSTFGFILNGLVFMFIGLQLPSIIENLGPAGVGNALKYGFVITGVLILTRLICVMGASPFTTFIGRFIRVADRKPGWKGPLIVAWAGMRGVVSLAAGLSIPFLSG